MSTKEQLEKRRDELVQEWSRLSNRYDKGLQSAGRFSEMAQDHYMNSEGPNRILAKMQEIDAEFSKISKQISEL